MQATFPPSASPERERDPDVAPAGRRRGIATAQRVARLTLGASADGKGLYESLGFGTKPDEMVYEEMDSRSEIGD